MKEICGHIGGDADGAFVTVCQQPKGHAGNHGGMGCEWDSGATPGRIPGDKGQRFEIHTLPNFPAGNPRTSAAWHNTIEGAIQLANSLSSHPEIEEAWVLDRAARYNHVYTVSADKSKGA